MDLYLIGTDYKKLPLEAREGLYRQHKDMVKFWAGQALEQAAILSTCNRLEIYGLAEDLADAHRQVSFFHSCFPEFYKGGYLKFGGREVFRHLLGLSCGLESQLKGESQILEQIEAWQKYGLASGPLREMAQRAISLGREIRCKSGLDLATTNIASLIFGDITANLGKDYFTAIIIGTGKVAELFSAFRPSQAWLFFASHRNFSKAKLLAQQSGGAEAIPLKEAANLIAQADVVISATKSPHFVVSLDTTAGIYLKRDKPLYLYDLGMPRGIQPEVGRFPGFILNNLDDLDPLFEKHNARIQDRLSMAEYLCEEIITVYSEAAYA